MKQFILETLKAKDKMDIHLLSIAETIIKVQQEHGIHDQKINIGSYSTNHSVKVSVGPSPIEPTTVYLCITETDYREDEDYENVINLHFPIKYLDMPLEDIFRMTSKIAAINKAGGKITWEELL